MSAVLFAVTGGCLWLGAAVVARHRAQSAADTAALAAAGALPSGVAAACARSEALTERLMVRQTSCSVEGLDVIVAVEAPIGFAGGVVAAQAAARAGPSDRIRR